MIQIRNGVFETNSSSTHSIVMCMKEEYDKWVSGEVYLNEYWGDSFSKFTDNKFVTKNEAIDIIEKSKYFNKEDLKDIDTLLKDEDFILFDDYGNDFESFYDEIETPNGEKVVSVGYYGWDG